MRNKPAISEPPGFPARFATLHCGCRVCPAGQDHRAAPGWCCAFASNGDRSVGPKGIYARLTTGLGEPEGKTAASCVPMATYMAMTAISVFGNRLSGSSEAGLPFVPSVEGIVDSFSLRLQLSKQLVRFIEERLFLRQMINVVTKPNRNRFIVRNPLDPVVYVF